MYTFIDKEPVVPCCRSCVRFCRFALRQYANRSSLDPHSCSVLGFWPLEEDKIDWGTGPTTGRGGALGDRGRSVSNATDLIESACERRANSFTFRWLNLYFRLDLFINCIFCFFCFKTEAVNDQVTFTTLLTEGMRSNYAWRVLQDQLRWDRVYQSGRQPGSSRRATQIKRDMFMR